MPTAQLSHSVPSCCAWPAGSRSRRQCAPWMGRAEARQPQAAWARRRRRCVRRPASSQQQQQQAEQDEDRDEGPFADFQLPKFRPFTPQNALQRAMTDFRAEYDCPGAPPGHTLLVTPLTPAWIRRTADLLTESFAEAMSAVPYRNYLRRQVRTYLEAHVLLPPKAVVLVALLVPPEAAGAQQQQQAAAAGGGLEDAGATQQASSSSGGGGDDPAGDGTQQQPAALSSSPDEDAELGYGSATQPLAGGVAGAGDASEASSGSGSDEDGGEAGVPAGMALVGVVELSFSASTRSKYLTLTPPEDRPYLCNMAVAPAHRGRGYGSALLEAAEALVAQLGEGEVYLHLRVQDAPAARLYSRAGYEQVASDTFLVRLLALDQRRLMRKRLAKPPPQL